MILSLSFEFVFLIKIEHFAVIHKTRSPFKRIGFLCLSDFFFLVFESRDIKTGDERIFLRA